MSSSEAPSDARPTCCENSANFGFDNKGTCPSNSCTQSGSGECRGDEQCLIYCVHWNTLNARLAKKSRALNRPATGLN